MTMKFCILKVHLSPGSGVTLGHGVSVHRSGSWGVTIVVSFLLHLLPVLLHRPTSECYLHARQYVN